MQLLLFMIVFSILSFISLRGHEALVSDDSSISNNDSLLTETSDDEVDLREEEVELEEGDYEYSESVLPLVEPDQELLDDYEENMKEQ